MKAPMTRFFAYVFATLGLAGPLASVAQSQGKLSASATKVRLAIPSPSLSFCRFTLRRKEDFLRAADSKSK